MESLADAAQRLLDTLEARIAGKATERPIGSDEFDKRQPQARSWEADRFPRPSASRPFRPASANDNRAHAGTSSCRS